MKTLPRKVLMTVLLLTTSMYAGGKGVIPADVSVVPIVVTNSSPIYVGIGLVAAQFSACSNDCDYEDRTYGAMLRAGYDFNQYFGFEARGIKTAWDEGPFGGVPLQHIGVYVKPQ